MCFQKIAYLQLINVSQHKNRLKTDIFATKNKTIT